MLLSEIAETGKWEPGQVLYLQMATDLLEQARFLPGQGKLITSGEDTRMSRTVEILHYTLHSGSGDCFHRIMRDISVPLHQCHGIDVVWSAQSLYDPDYYILVRAFDSPESMSAVLNAFYAGDDWRRRAGELSQ